MCAAAQVAWILVVGTLSADHSVFAPLDLPAHQAIRAAIGRSPEWYHEMIGTFGWLDTPSPALTVVIWTIVVGGLLALALALGRRRWWLATLVAFGITFFLPIALEFAQAVGWATGHWQGRYALPFAVGVPLLATMSLERDGPGARLSASLLPVGLAVALGVAVGPRFAQNLRRYTVGYDGHVWFFIDPQWAPPGGALLVTVGFTVRDGVDDRLAADRLRSGRRQPTRRPARIPSPPRSLRGAVDVPGHVKSPWKPVAAGGSAAVEDLRGGALAGADRTVDRAVRSVEVSVPAQWTRPNGSCSSGP